MPAVASTRLVGAVNTAAVALEAALVVVVSIALAIAVPVTGDGDTGNLTSRGIAAILRDQLGPVMERVPPVAITFACFGAGVVALTACARLVFAMARDGPFPAHRLMRRVGPRTRTRRPGRLLPPLTAAGGRHGPRPTGPAVGRTGPVRGRARRCVRRRCRGRSSRRPCRRR
ncbi:amino acid permease [Streptomyces sp. NPDC096136]|uniref:amino acid permease n=1 Tax=Streptomyces sp. NPDC096136 TaxID=3366076 RepID=UPI00381471EE